MSALTPAEKQAAYRKRKEAKEFDEIYDLPTYPSVDDFIEAKLAEASIKFRADVVQFEGSLISAFYDALNEFEFEWASEYLDAEEFDVDYPVYSTQDMLSAWKEAEKG